MPNTAPAQSTVALWRNRAHLLARQTVAEALLEQKAIAVMYLSRTSETEKPLTLHPQEIVSRHSATYLLAHVDGFEDLRQFALHRVKHAAFSQRAWQARDRLRY